MRGALRLPSGVISPMRAFVKYSFPVLAYSVIIFYISGIPAAKLTFTHYFWDKFLHLVEYAPLGFLCARAIWVHGKWSKMAVWVASVSFGYVYGLSDEFHQSFTLGRASCLSDALADFLGSAFGAGIYLIVKTRDITQLTKKD